MNVWLIFIVMYLVMALIGGVLIWAYWKKPLLINLRNKLRTFTYGNKGVTIRLLDNNMNEYEIVAKVTNSDGIVIDHERYVVVPDSAVRKRLKSSIDYVSNHEDVLKPTKTGIKPEEKVVRTEHFLEYKFDKNAVKMRNWKQDTIFTYLQGYPLPLSYDLNKHIKENVVNNYLVTSTDLNKYMKKKIFTDKVYDDNTLKLIQYTGIAILVGVCAIAFVVIKGALTPAVGG